MAGRLSMQFLGLVLAAFLSQTGSAQKVCDPLDQGPFLATQPTLTFIIDEATDEDIRNALASNSKKFYSELRLAGNYGAGEFSLSTGLNYQFIDPMEYFETVTEGNVNYMRLKKALDRDGMTSAIDDDTTYVPFTLTCTPADTNLSPVVYDARIFINDINDNDPVFLSDIEVTISEATSVGTVVFTAVAEDKDANLEKNLTYSLLNHKDKFDIDPETGDVSVTSELDYESMGDNKYFDLTLEVEDGGPGATKTATTTARVHITDADDLRPAYVYTGCFTHLGLCAWPKYTTGLTLKKDTVLVVLPVPNKGTGPVKIQAMDQDKDIANEIVFKIASTIPPGHENEFRVDTVKGQDNMYTANIIPLKDMVVNEGFEIFLKAEEQSAAMRNEMTMIFFTGGADSSSSQGQGSNGSPNNQDGDDDDGTNYTDTEIALIVVVAILASFLVCALAALIYSCRTRRGRKEVDFSMATTNNGFNERL